VRGGRLKFDGISGGFRAYCEWDSRSGLEVIFVANLHTGAPDVVRSAIPRLAAGERLPPPAMPPPPTRPVSADALERCRGTFELANGTRLVVRPADGVLWANGWMLPPLADGGYFSPREYGRVRGVAGADGRIERLDWEQRGEVYPAPRVGGGPQPAGIRPSSSPGGRLHGLERMPAAG
jgi:hypothetical protein